MRQAIETVPTDDKFVILEDDATGTYEVARWSAEAGGWVAENGAPSKITPTYWHPLSQEDNGSGLSPTAHQGTPDRSAVASGANSLGSGAVAARVTALDVQAALVRARRGPRARRQLAVLSMAAILAGAALVGFLFRVELASYAARYAHVDIAKIGAVSRNPIERIVKHETASPSQESQSAESSVHDRKPLHRPFGSREHAPVAQTAEGALEPRKSSDKEQRRTGDSANALDEAAKRKQAADATADELQQSLQQEREKTEALTRELAKARDEIEAHAALSSKVGAEAAQVKQAAESATAELGRLLQEERDRAEAVARELESARREVEAHISLATKTVDEAAKRKQAADATADESLQQEREKTEALTRELAKARDEIEAHAALSSKVGAEAAQVKQAAESATAELGRLLQEERDRAEAVARELESARREVEAHISLATKTVDEAAKRKQAADATADESLQQEREKTEALTRELAKARDEIEAHAALSSKVGAEAAQVKQAAESATAELGRLLQEERDRAEAVARELESARREVEARIAFERAANSAADLDLIQAAQAKQAAEAAAAEFKRSLEQEQARSRTLEMQLAAQKDSGPASNATGAANTSKPDISSSPATQEKGNQGAASERPAATATQGGPEAARLLARASALLGEGNVGAARIVLERAAEIGSIQATFALAETYDPLVLLTWRTYGTRGDATKARDLYAKAYAAGIQDAKDRLNALSP